MELSWQAVVHQETENKAESTEYIRFEVRFAVSLCAGGYQILHPSLPLSPKLFESQISTLLSL